jgi:hypothetical protein
VQLLGQQLMLPKLCCWFVAINFVDLPVKMRAEMRRFRCGAYQLLSASEAGRARRKSAIVSKRTDVVRAFAFFASATTRARIASVEWHRLHLFPRS